jgi:NAD(P)-dependent dehydrogenase (short-subunit alcohol dehydrogenase family)
MGAAGYRVILAARREDELKILTEELKGKCINASYVVMNIADEDNVKAAAVAVEEQFGRLDVLINDAALMRAGETVERQDIAELRQVFDTNVIGTWIVCQKFIPLLRKSEHPRIVNVSSGAGSYGDPVYGLLKESQQFPVLSYGISKLAVNGITVKLAKEVQADHILVNSVCPDVTDTFGSNGAFGRSVEVSAKSVTWAAMLPDDGPTGRFFRDGKELPW